MTFHSIYVNHRKKCTLDWSYNNKTILQFLNSLTDNRLSAFKRCGFEYGHDFSLLNTFVFKIIKEKRIVLLLDKVTNTCNILTHIDVSARLAHFMRYASTF